MGSNKKNIGERSEPSGGSGRGKGPPPLSPPQATTRLASLANFFSFFPQCGAQSQASPYRFLLQSRSFFLLFFRSRQSNFSTNSPVDAGYAAEKLMVRRHLHYHKKKNENGARHCTFNLVHLIAHQTLEPFFIKTFCCGRLLSYHFVTVLLSSHYLSRPVCLC